MGRGSSKANRAKYNGKQIYVRKNESVDDAIKRYEAKLSADEAKSVRVFSENAPTVEITTSYWAKRNKFDTYVSEAFDSGEGIITLYTPDNEDRKRKSKNETEVTYTLQHGIAGKESYGINWDNVNVVKNGTKSLTFHHQSLLENKGFVWDKELQAYVKPNSNFKQTKWYKEKMSENLGLEEKRFFGTSNRF